MATKKPRQQDYHIFIVSDATGETAEKVVIAALSQFGIPNVIITRYKEVRTDPQVIGVVEEAVERDACIVYTIISPKLRAFLHRRATRQKIPAVDLMGSLLTHLTAYLRRSPISQPGLVHKIDEDYFKRIEAMEFVVKHDDGQSLQTLQEADIVLVGISRTTKTPLSIYLAREGWKVSNVPLIYGIGPPPELFAIHQRRIVGLMIDPQRLSQIRKDRFRHAYRGVAFEYDAPEYVLKETAYSRELFAQHPEWTVVDVTNRAVEELAHDIVGRIIGRARKL